MPRSTIDAQRTQRTTVEIDVDALQAAKAVLGTATTRETIDAALRQVDRRARLARAAALIASGGLETVAPQELDALRQARG